jgi:hypothetical protein
MKPLDMLGRRRSWSAQPTMLAAVCEFYVIAFHEAGDPA